MVDLKSADDIMSVNKVGDLFSPDVSKLKSEYRQLAKMWHPDCSDDARAAEVFNKISALYDRGLEILKCGEWERTGFVKIAVKGGSIEVVYSKLHDFELGKVYVCRDRLMYAINKEHKDFCNNAVAILDSLKCADSRMENEFRSRIPNLTCRYENSDFIIISVPKPDDMLLLSDVAEYCDYSLDGRHAAWIMSRLYNMCCYLQYNGIVHNGINAVNCCICPDTHDILLAGGWWYACSTGSRMLGTTADIYDVMPVVARDSHLSYTATDLESVKLVGRMLTAKSKIPDRFREWLISGSCNDAFVEYHRWYEMLKGAYGERKFVIMDLNFNDVYQ